MECEGRLSRLSSFGYLLVARVPLYSRQGYQLMIIGASALADMIVCFETSIVLIHLGCKAFVTAQTRRCSLVLQYGCPETSSLPSRRPLCPSQHLYSLLHHPRHISRFLPPTIILPGSKTRRLDALV